MAQTQNAENVDPNFTRCTPVMRSLHAYGLPLLRASISFLIEAIAETP
jgi:hypothetical protein